MDTVTVCIPTLTTRQRYLGRAMSSVCRQTHPVAAVAVAVDLDREGAWATRNRAVDMAAATDWVAFLDDDDQLLPHHVEVLLRAAREAGADCVWGWYEVVGGSDPWPERRGCQYDPADPHVVPITYMVRRELVQAARAHMGGFQPDAIGAWDNQDKPLFDYFAREGTLYAIPDTTWEWWHHGGNTSGLPTRGS